MAATVPLIALRAFPYGRLKLQPDQAFDAPASDARVLTRIGHARAAEKSAAWPPPQTDVDEPDEAPPIVPPPDEPDPDDVDVEQDPEEARKEPAQPLTVKRRTPYKRKDLSAER